jgi:hypothetical protein
VKTKYLNKMKSGAFKFIIPLVIMTGCFSFQSLTLNDVSSPINPDAVPGKIILFNRGNANLNMWYSCVKSKPRLTINDSIIQVGLKNSKGECFGIFFDPRDISETPVIKISARFQASVKSTSVDILAGFTDEMNRKTYYPEKAKIIKSGGNFLDYYFDYSDEINFADRHVDPSNVKTVLIFVNILGLENLSGVISIEEIILCKKVPN